MQNQEISLIRKTIENRYQKTLGEKFSPVFDDELKIHEPKIPSKDLLEYVKRRQKVQKRLSEERSRLKSAENEALGFYENKKARKRKRKAIGLKICNGWKILIYLIWIVATAKLNHESIQSAGSIGAYLTKLSNTFNADNTDYYDLTVMGTWLGFLVVFWLLSKIRLVSLRILFNLIFSILIGGIAYLTVFLNVID